MILQLRGLVGEWEDGDVVFLGAVPVENFENFNECNGWEQRKQEWIDCGPNGIGETREIDIHLQVPGDVFDAPLCKGRSLPAEPDGGGES